MSELQEDTRVEPAGPGRYEGALTDRWVIGAGLNGGYVMTAVARAVQAEAVRPHLLTMTMHFMSRAEPGPFAVEVERPRPGRSHETLVARLVQDGAIGVAVATCGERRPGGPELRTLDPPDLPSPGECRTRTRPADPGMTFLDRFDYRYPQGQMDRIESGERHEPRYEGWVRLVDDDFDEPAVCLLADCFPPPVFGPMGLGYVPTLELTVHFRGDPGPGWTAARFESRVLSGGYVEEDGDMWTSDGRLVAQSRQLSRFTPFD